MRTPPLPGPVTPLSPDRLAARAVGDRSVDTPVAPITIEAYDPDWPGRYVGERACIRDALGARALAVEHVGSTAVPGLAAKDRLDIDLIVADPTDETAYVPALAAAGYALRTREPDWYQHRCLWSAGHTVNLHVFGPDCDEHLRHLVFRDWLRTHPDDRAYYAAEKRRAAADHPWSMSAYNAQKAGPVLEILRRAGLRPAATERPTRPRERP
ncbi:MAG TPA: GrpB family protein [Actinocatenispora sp.]